MCVYECIYNLHYSYYLILLYPVEKHIPCISSKILTIEGACWCVIAIIFIKKIQAYKL